MKRLILLFLVIGIKGAAFLDPLHWVKTRVDPSVTGVYFTIGQDKNLLLSKLKEERTATDVGAKEFDEVIRVQLDKIAQLIAQAKERSRDRFRDFWQKKLSLLNESHQTLIDTQLSYKQAVVYLDQQIKVLEEYVKDPEFKDVLADTKGVYSFENLQQMSEKIGTQDEQVQHLEEQKTLIVADIENRKKSIESLIKQYKEKEYEQKDLAHDDTLLTIKQRAELLDLQMKLLIYKRKLIEQKILEDKRKLSFLDARIFIAREMRRMIDAQREQMKEGLRVDESDVRVARATLEKKKQQYLDTKEGYYHTRKTLISDREQLKERLETIARRFDVMIGDVREFDDVSISPSDAQGYYSLCALLHIKEQILVLDKRIELLDAHIHFEEVQFEREQGTFDSIESWYKMSARQFRSEEDVENEVRRYLDPLKQAERDFIAFSEKRNNATSFINIQNKVIEHIKKRARQLEENRQLFKESMDFLIKTRELIAGAYRLANEQIEINAKILDVYSMIITMRNSTMRHMQAVVNELNNIGPRSPHAISWQGIKNMGTDLMILQDEFGQLAVAFVKQFSATALLKQIRATTVTGIARTLFILLFFILAYFLLRAGMFFAQGKVQALLIAEASLVLRFFVGVLLFIAEHFVAFFVWSSIWLALRLDLIHDLFVHIVFLYASIPFFFYISSAFVSFIARFNIQQGHAFFAPDTYARFKWRVRFFLYLTIFVFFFRQAYVLATYSVSELPIILLALYSVTVRFLLISVVRKEDVVAILPDTQGSFAWVRDMVAQQYPIIFGVVAGLVVLSEPHIGYGRYISYCIWGLIGSALLIRGLFFVYMFVKNVSSTLFFVIEGENLRERFVYARSAYGAFVMLTFLICAIITFILGARVWGYTVSLSNIYDVLHTTLFTINEGTTDKRDITTVTLLQILSFVLGSFVVASVINHFVLRSIFDLLMLESGVQHTVATITHYCIVMVVVLIGFQRVGLGYIVLLLVAPLALAVGWSMRDYANDFVSYFIILVQRPFKIGDLVKFDETEMGVVRKITPRSVIMRIRNSVTVLVPNSKIINGQITNWSYARNFTATPDLRLSVGYDVDPTEVRTIISRVIDAHMHALKNPRPVIRLEDFGEHGFIFLVRVYLSIDSVSHIMDIASDLRLNIAKALKERGIPISAPAQTYKTVAD